MDFLKWFDFSLIKNLSKEQICDLTEVFLLLYVCVLYLVLPRCGDPGLDEESSMLAVSMREDLLWSCLPAVDRGLFTAPKTLAALG